MHPRSKTAQPLSHSVTVIDGVTLPTSPAIVAENALTGHAWWVTTPQQAGDVEGYADAVSAVSGNPVTLYVSTKAATFHVEAYRMGYYQGIGARLVWTSDEIPGVRQPLPALLSPTNTIECDWSPSLTLTVDDDWPPGAYLLKLVGATGEQGFIPLCVRDDSSRAAIVIQHSVTTWQAYNRWGGYSLYYGNNAGRSPSPTRRRRGPTPTGRGSSRSTGPTTTTGHRVLPTSSATSCRWSSTPSGWGST